MSSRKDARRLQVAKKKDSVALFEVISKSRDKKSDSEIAVPGWAKPAAQGDQPAEAAEATEAVEAVETAEATEPVEPVEAAETPEPTEPTEQEGYVAEVQTPAPVTLQTTSTRTPRPAAASTGLAGRPMLDTADGRLTVSLNYVSSMVAAVGLLLLMSIAFVLGRMTAPAPSPPVEAAKWQVGQYYLVIETLEGITPKARAEADRIVKFCKANNEPCEVQQLDSNLIVWSMTPFDSPKDELAKAHALKIQNELGSKYQQKYGTKYRFSQQKNGVFNPVFFPYKERAAASRRPPRRNRTR